MEQCNKGAQLLDLLNEVKAEKEEKAAAVAEETKVCNRCSRALPATEKYFYKDKRNRNGLSSWCRECHRETQKERDLKKSLVGRVEPVHLDFAECPEMYIQLSADARQDFRRVDQQVLWIINDYFNRMQA